MDQLSHLIEELHWSVSSLHPIRDQQLVKYLCGEVQHLINRVESGHPLSSDETQELASRRHTVKVFKAFYAFMLMKGSL